MNKAITFLCDIIGCNVNKEILYKMCTKKELAYGIGGNEDISDLEIFVKSAVLLVQKENLDQ